MKFRPDHTDLVVGRVYVCVIPWLGVMAPGSDFVLPAHKTEVRGNEIRAKSKRDSMKAYDGSISIDPQKKRVVVKLTEDGVRFRYNGKYKYRE